MKSEKNKDTEISIDNIKIDRLTKEYLTEIKKSDADEDASKWQLIYYLKILKDKGIDRKGKLEFVEKTKSNKILIIELNEEILSDLDIMVSEIKLLVLNDKIPRIINKPGCKKCSYYEYCYI